MAVAVNLVWGNLTIPAARVVNSVAAKDRQLAVAGARSAVPLTYGQDRLGALILNVLPLAPDSNTLLVQCLWGFACDGVFNPLLNNQALPAGSTVASYTGAQVTPHAALVSAFAAQGITYSDALTGYAYSVIAMPVREFNGQLDFSARIQGRRLYDPRKDSTQPGGSGAHRLATPATWEWSDNPALACADFVYSNLYGLNLAVDWPSIMTAANACNALIGSPAEKRRTLGVSFIAPANAVDVADTLRGYAGCFLLQGPAGAILLPDAADAASASYSHAAGEIAALDSLVKSDLGNLPTAVEIVYTDTSQIPWRDASATAQHPDAGGALPWRLSQVRLPGVQRYSQAMREAIERLNKLTLSDLSCTLEVFDVGIRHQVGDIVNITHPLGMAAKPMRVAGVEMAGAGRWRLQLIEHDPAAYSTVVVTAPSTPDTGFVNPAGPPAAVAGFASATLVEGARLTWTANAESDVTGYELRVGGANWAAGVPLDGAAATHVGGTSYLWYPAPGTYTVRICARDSEGLYSLTAASVSVTVTGELGTQIVAAYIYQRKATAPAPPTTTCTYTFATGIVTGMNNGWTAAIPAGSDPLYVSTALARGAGLTATIAPGEWAAAAILARDGADGAPGAPGTPGTDGMQTATAYLYQWSTVTPGDPTGTSVYTWASGAHGSYSGDVWWKTAMPANPGTPGLRLWVASKPITAPGGTATTTVSWASGYTKAAWAGNGASGLQTARPTVYRWEPTIPLPPAGSPTYTWASGSFGAAPSGWQLTPGASPSVGYTLWAAEVAIVDSAAAPTTEFSWASASITARGYAGSDGAPGTDGSPGQQGASARYCYQRVPANPAPTSGNITTSGSSSFPTSSQSNTTWGINQAWVASDPNPSSTNTLYQADGIYDPATGNTVWSTPYISSLKVGSLSAITVNTGALTVQDALTIASTGYIRGGQSAYDVGDGFFLGYSGGAYRFSISGASGYGLTWDGSILRIRAASFVGSITVSSTGHIKGGQTDYNTGAGFYLGYSGSAYKFSIGNPSGYYMLWTGTDLIVNAQSLGLPSFSASIGGGAINVAVANGSWSYGSRTVTPSGGSAPYTYRWSLINPRYDGSGRAWTAVGDTTITCSFSGQNTNAINTAVVQCLVTDNIGRVATAYVSLSATHGTPA